MALTELSGVLGVKRAAHLLRRATFGATKADIDQFAQLTAAEAVAALFGQPLAEAAPPNDPLTGQPWVFQESTDANSDESDLQEYFKGWFIGQMMSAGVDPGVSLAWSARERIVMFLHCHFTTIQSKVNHSRALYFQNQLYRFFALDGLNSDPEINFKTLTVKVSVDNAMLRLLDGNLNVKGSPNENYARELLELYSIGRGLEGTLPEPSGPGDYILFTEEDVQAAARILSGWQTDDDFDLIENATIDADTGLPRGKVRGSAQNASAHDNDPKTFSDRFGRAVIQGDPTLMNLGNPTEESALDEIRQLIDLIYSQPETARNICRKLYRFFVHAPHTTEDAVAIENAVIEEMADVFRTSNFKLQPVLENLFRSEHFYESNNGDLKDDNFGGIIKSPLDLIVGTYRMFGIALPDPSTDADAFYEATGDIIRRLGLLGMNFFEPYDVAGYEAYHQFPVYHRTWITPNFLARRYEFIRDLFRSAQPGLFVADALQFVRDNIDNATASDARSLIIELARYFFPFAENLTFDDTADDQSTLTVARLNYFKGVFLQGFDDSYWTERWTNNAIDLRYQLELLFNAMLQTPEYQLA